MIVLKARPCEAKGSLSFLSIMEVTEALGGSLKFMLKPDDVVIERLVDPEDITLETSARSKMPRSLARSFRA